jgi:hypothetical protein
MARPVELPHHIGPQAMPVGQRLCAAAPPVGLAVWSSKPHVKTEFIGAIISLIGSIALTICLPPESDILL